MWYTAILRAGTRGDKEGRAQPWFLMDKKRDGAQYERLGNTKYNKDTDTYSTAEKEKWDLTGAGGILSDLEEVTSVVLCGFHSGQRTEDQAVRKYRRMHAPSSA